VRRLLIAAIFALLVGIVIFFLSDSKDDSASTDIFSLPVSLTDGRDTTLGDLVSETGRPLIVNFWATWCAPCLEELPMFESTNQRLKHEIDFLGVNVSDSPTKAKEMITATGISYLTGSDPEGNFLVELGVVGLPATVFISKQGDLIDLHIGQISSTDLDMKISWIR
jgi:thiol-disulfide isomerase/thioredoxin